MLQQVEFALRPRPRGFHLVTDEVLCQLPELPRTGFCIYLSSIPVVDCQSVKMPTPMFGLIWSQSSIGW